MEINDSLKFSAEATPVVLHPYNSVLITSILIKHAVFFLILFAAFRSVRDKKMQNLFLPLLILLAVLAYPLFSGLNLWPVAWLPQLTFPYELQLHPECYLTDFDSFSLFYYKWIPYAITLIYCVLVAIFIEFLYKQNYFNKSQRWLLFVPFINHFLIARYFLHLTISVLSKIICLLLIIVSCLHWFYRTIGLMLLLYGVDTYSWYYDLVFGSSMEYPVDGSVSHYTLFNDYLFHFNMSLLFVCTLLMFPVYIILNKLHPQIVAEDSV